MALSKAGLSLNMAGHKIIQTHVGPVIVYPPKKVNVEK